MSLSSLGSWKAWRPARLGVPRLQMQDSSLCLCHHRTFSLCVFLLMKTPVIKIWVTRILRGLIFT